MLPLIMNILYFNVSTFRSICAVLNYYYYYYYYYYYGGGVIVIDLITVFSMYMPWNLQLSQNDSGINLGQGKEIYFITLRSKGMS